MLTVLRLWEMLPWKNFGGRHLRVLSTVVKQLISLLLQNYLLCLLSVLLSSAMCRFGYSMVPVWSMRCRCGSETCGELKHPGLG